MKTYLLFVMLLLSAVSVCSAQKTTIPYPISQRPLPKGANFLKIMPEKAGDFTRIRFKAPRPGFDGECVYSDGKNEVFVLFGLAKDYNETQKTIKTMALEAETEDATENKQLFKKDPSYALLVNAKTAFFVWTRGFYYFAADAKAGKEVLDRFITSFPY